MNIIIQEVIGFAGSVLVLASFTLNGEKAIRKVSILSCVVFLVYGILLGSPTLICMNLAVFFVHIWKLNKLKKEQNALDK